MKVQICDNKSDWENGLNKHFLQSWEWGQSRLGTIGVQLLENGQVKAQFLGFEIKLLFGFSYISIPRGDLNEKALKEGVEYLKSTKKYVFARIEPIQSIEPYQKTTDYTLHRTRSRQWQHTLVLDLSPSEDELLDAMHSKTRYNIRLAGRRGVEVKETDIDTFWQLSEQTAQRDGIKTHDKAYYENMAKVPGVVFLGGFLDGKPLCAGIFIQYNGRMTYVHGASSNENRNVMAPYLLQWQAMKKAKADGCKEYDFGGIAAPAVNTIATKLHTLQWDINDKLTGVTRFKAGFGGKRESYGDAFEVPLRNFWYKVFLFMKKLR